MIRRKVRHPAAINSWRTQEAIISGLYLLWNLKFIVICMFYSKISFWQIQHNMKVFTTEWAGKGALIQKNIENLVRPDLYPILQQPSQTRENASTEPFSAAPGASGGCVILPLP